MILTYRSLCEQSWGLGPERVPTPCGELGTCMSRHGMGLGLGTIPALRTRNTKTGQADGSEGRVWRDPNISSPEKFSLVLV
jgi:hypothetical protein